MITVSGFLNESPADVEVQLESGRIRFFTKGIKKEFDFCNELVQAMHLVPINGYFSVCEEPKIHIPGPEVRRILDSLKHEFMREANVSNVAFTSMALTISEPFAAFYARLRFHNIPEKITESACDTFLNGLITMILRGRQDEE